MQEGDELADLHTFLLSPLLRATVGTIFAASGLASFGDRRGLEVEASRDFEESELLEPRGGGLAVSLGDIFDDILEAVGAFAARGGLLGAVGPVVVVVWFDWLCFLAIESGAFDTFGLLLALTKREPPPPTVHLGILSNMSTNNFNSTLDKTKGRSQGRCVR